MSHDKERCGCEIRCGCFRTKRVAFTSEILGRLNSPKGALLFLSLAAFLQGSVTNGFYNINISTLEKRFGLRSSETGFISSSYDIAGCFAIPVFTYIGGAGHKPLWIGSGSLLLGVGSLFLALPHFLAPTYFIADLDKVDCDAHAACGETSLRTFRGFFIVGQMLMGVGATPLYTLALSYLDENVEQVRSSTYHGIFYAAALLGPGIGYLLGGYFLTLFTTLEDQEGVSIENPLWIGNWWLGFLIVGIFFILLSLPLLMFPEQMPGTDRCRQDRDNEMHQQESALRVQGDKEFGKSIRDAPRCLVIVLKNSTIVLISLANSLDSGMMIGLATFGPKYIESQFSASASHAALYFGALAIVTASFAHLISGIIISKFSLSVPQMLKMSLACACVAFCCLFIFTLRCDNPDIAGVFIPYANESTVRQDESQCARAQTLLYRPICGADNLTYLSFCDAGCKIDYSDLFDNCTRIGGPSSTAKRGACAHDACTKLWLFLPFIGLAVFFTFMKGQTTLQSSLRVVPFSQRSFTLGIQWLIIRLVGAIPLPIIFGRVLDMSCLVWGLECGECGSCHVYDNRSMATSMAWLNLMLKGMNLSLLIAVNLAYKSPPSDISVSYHPGDRSSLIENTARICIVPHPVV